MVGFGEQVSPHIRGPKMLCDGVPPHSNGPGEALRRASSTRIGPDERRTEVSQQELTPIADAANQIREM